MKKYLGINYLLAVVLLNISVVAAENHITADFSQQEVVYQYLEDVPGALDIAEVMAMDDNQFRAGTPGGPNFGFTRSTFWLKLKVTNKRSTTADAYLEVAYPQLDQVGFFQTTDGSIVRHIELGDHRNFYPRDVDHPNFIFHIKLEPEKKNTIYIRSKSDGSVHFPLNLIEPTTFYNNKNREQLLQFSYFGAFFFMFLLNAAIYYTLREKTYLYYTGMIFSFIVFFAGLRGYLFQLVLPYYWQLAELLFIVSLPILAIFLVQFSRYYLKTRENHPRLDRLLKYIAIIEVANIFVSLLVPYKLSIMISVSLGIPMWAVLISSGIIAWAHRERSGIYFTVSWAVLTAGGSLTALHQFGLLDNEFWVINGLQIGSALEAMILNFSLAERLYQEREQKIAAQSLALSEIKNRRDAQNQVIHLALHDQETALPNKMMFEMKLADIIKSDPEKPYMIALIALERLHEIGKTLGLSYTDKIRREFAIRTNNIVSQLPGTNIIEKNEQNSAWLCTINNNIFGLLVDYKTAMDSRFHYFHAMKEFREPFKFEGLSIELPTSFGASRYPKDSTDPTELVRKALVSVGESKKFNYNFTFFVPSMDIYDSQRLTMLTELRQAINTDKITVHYQPKISIATGEINGVEALVRWRHEVYGNIPPDKFIPIAEKTGIIRDLTRKVISEALEHFTQLRSLIDKLKISINLSARNLIEEDLNNWIAGQLRDHNISVDSLILELTETAIISDREQGVKALNRFDTSGICISIDDFGTGHSSLHYLKELPVRELKIDRSLVADLNHSRSSRIIVEKTIEICEALGYRVVAEGIEDQATLNSLKEMNCHLAQGYFISPPLPINELLKWIKNRIKQPELL